MSATQTLESPLQSSIAGIANYLTHSPVAAISPQHFVDHWDDMTVLWVFLAVFGYAVRTIPPATNPWAIWAIGILQFFAANWDKILQPANQGHPNSLITPVQANQQAFSAAASQGPGPIQQPIPISISKQEQQ